MQIEDIESGNSYACKFKVKTFINDEGTPVSTKHLQPGQSVDGEPGDYEGFGIIKTRDKEKELVEIIDINMPDQEWVVSWDNCWDIDSVEWVDQ